MRLLLNAHSEIAIPPESHFIAKIVRLKLSSERALDYLLENTHFRYWKMELSEDAKLHLRKSESLAVFFDRLYTYHAKKMGKRSWGDKTPRYVFRLPLLHELFPGARIVQLIRDPRDVCTSLLSVPWHKGGIVAAARQWDRAIESGLKVGQPLFAERYIFLNFEALLEDPESCLRKLCAELEIDYEHSMLSFYMSAKTDMGEDRVPWHANVYNPIQRDRIGQWRRFLADWEVSLIEHICAETMTAFGYKGSSQGLGFKAYIELSKYRISKRVGRTSKRGDRKKTKRRRVPKSRTTTFLT